jgi:adenine-specific DNA glycosylase
MEQRGTLLRILEEFSQNGAVLGAPQVARVLDKDPRVVAGMLDALVQLGRLEVADAPGCDLCPLRMACELPEKIGRCYRLAP